VVGKPPSQAYAAGQSESAASCPWQFVKQAPELTDAEQRAINNKNQGGAPYDKAAHNSGMRKMRTGQKHTGARRNTQNWESNTPQ
jgi:ribosomal protein L4